MNNSADVHENEGQDSGAFAPEESAALTENAELKTPELRENKVIYTFVLFLAIAAVICLFVVLFFISKQGAETSKLATPASSKSGSAVKSDGSGSSNSDPNAIKVVKVTPTVYENGALDQETIDAMNNAKTANERAAAYEQEVAARLSGDSSPASPVKYTYSPSSKTAKTSTSATTKTTKVTKVTPTKTAAAPATAPIVGVDEDVAKQNLRAQGFKAYSVYVCDEGALSGMAARPKNGMVLSQLQYTGRTVGEKLAFVSVATSASYTHAKIVPDLSGKAWKSARATLARRGLRIRYEYEDKSPAKYGTVVFQAPAAGTHIPRGCSVMVVLAD